MSLPLILTEEAERDLAEARDYYDRRRAGLGDEFLERIEAAMNHIRRVPEGSTEVQPGVRRTVVRGFPYNVIYRIDADQIAVIAVYHGKRDPRGWQQRL